MAPVSLWKRGKNFKQVSSRELDGEGAAGLWDRQRWVTGILGAGGLKSCKGSRTAGNRK